MRLGDEEEKYFAGDAGAGGRGGWGEPNGRVCVTREFLSRIRVGAPRRRAGLTLFPLIADPRGGLPLRSLEEAFERGDLRVTEAGSEGRVPELLVENAGDLPVLILDGEELEGGRQNRVLNVSVLLAPRMRVSVPVSCVEAGRWAYRRSDFIPSGHLMPREARAEKGASVGERLRARQEYTSDQRCVWDEVDRLARELRTAPSRTSAMKDLLDGALDGAAAGAEPDPPEEGETGVLVLRDGQVLGLEAVGRCDLWRRVREKVLRSWLIEEEAPGGGRGRGRRPAGEEGAGGEGAERERAERFLEDCGRLPFEAYPSPGLGIHCRFEGGGVQGSSLIYADDTLHLLHFARPARAR